MPKIPLVNPILVALALLAGTAPACANVAWSDGENLEVADSVTNAASVPEKIDDALLMVSEAAVIRRRQTRRPGKKATRTPGGEGGSGRTQRLVPDTPRGGDWSERRWAGKGGGLPPVDYSALSGEMPPVPDRWRIVDTLGYESNLWDPYHGNNPLKADKPVFGKDWFFNLGVISDTIMQSRRIPVPVGNATTRRSGSLDTQGDGKQLVFNENLIVEMVLYKGDTVFRPPDYEFRFIPVFNLNYVDTRERGLIKVDPDDGGNNGRSRYENFVGVQGLFVDKHLRNVSDRYDFDSLRVGIQPITADFRGFLFNDEQLGIRLFGNRNNNIFQYNLAWFRRLDKDINSGLNDLGASPRDDDVFLANLYWQDLFTKGFTSQATVVYNRNRERDDITYDENGFITRPGSSLDERGRDYDVTYFGYSGDGHIGRLNLSTSLYYAYGEETSTRLDDVNNDIRAYFAAAETSMDFDWIRWRLSGLYASGDDDPFDTDSTGFDAIFENPRFAGADTSYYISQSIPLIGGGGVTLTGRNAMLNSLRSSKEQGQSNFVNPGLKLLGIGADLDVLPELRLSFNVNQLWFDDTSVLEVQRQQASISTEIGTDISLALIYRPKFIQNMVLRLSAAVLEPGQGYKDLYGDGDRPYSVLGNIILTY